MKFRQGAVNWNYGSGILLAAIGTADPYFSELEEQQMKPISNMISGTAAPPEAVGRAKETPKVHQTEDESKDRPFKPVTDEYIPEKKEDPAGRYWLGKDEDGRPKIFFDNPQRTADAPEPDTPSADKKASGPPAPEKASEDKNVKTCTCNTDKVDREIEKLKKKQKELKSQLNSETDETKIQELKKNLTQVENELRQKDNDTYRRQNAEYTYS